MKTSVRSVAHCCIALASCLCATAQTTERPLALLALESNRGRLVTGEVHWSIKCNRPGSFYSTQRYYTSQFTPHEMLTAYQGDPEGIVQREPDGSASPKIGYRPQFQLFYDNATWMHIDRGRVADVHQEKNDLHNVRSFGISSALPWGNSCRRLIWKSWNDCSYQTRVVHDGLHEVTASRVGRDFAIRRVLDPERGWNPIRVEVWKDGQLRRHSRCTLRKYGDVSFPERVEMYDSDYEEGRKPLYVMHISSASFNQADQPRRLTPEDIGIQVGTNIYVHDRDGQLLGVHGWDGQKLVPLDQLHARIKAGELTVGAEHAAEVQRALAEGRRVDSGLSDWERYTLAFIELYRLDSDQSQKAIAVLRDCQAKARNYAQRKKDKFKKIREAVASLYDSSSPKAVDRSAKIEEYKQQMFKLQAPIWRIFSQELKPRLERLPTRAQREAAQAAASQPAKTAENSERRP